MQPRMVRIPEMGAVDLSGRPYFIVASVELGNVVTKCTFVATDLETRRTYVLGGGARPTREIRPPGPDEGIIGRTVAGVELAETSVEEFVADVVRLSLESARLNLDDLHFVVCSTDAVAGLASPSEVDAIVKTIANGCSAAGVRPEQMVPPLEPTDMPTELRSFSALGRRRFDGIVAGMRTFGRTRLSANQMKGELALAGVKEGARSVVVDLRNPVMAIHFGTLLAGLVTGDEELASPVGIICGLGGAIPDAMARGSGGVDRKLGAALDLPPARGDAYAEMAGELAARAMKTVGIGRVSVGRPSVGMIPIDTRAAYEAGAVPIGCDVGRDGKDLPKLIELGCDAASYGLPTLHATIDRTCAQVVARLIKTADDEGLLTERTAFGIAGRAGITGDKPRLVLELLGDMGFDDIANRVVFVGDGLALGGAVRARCLCALCPACPPLCGARGKDFSAF
ncbi:MAG: methanogenesis marker 14 protein [Candidatus Hodarchaeaceae archaeon]|nr:methanogenesis marker 14 protein [Candidatus Hodarchaeaceae archaeon]